SRRSVRHIPQRRSAAMILTTLNHEWARLVETTDVTVWAASCSALANANDLDMVLAATKGDDPDRVLRFLISQHQAGDLLAGRTVLQAMLPKVCTMLRWRRAHFQTDPMSDMIW